MSAGELLRLLNLFQPRSYSAGEAVLRKGDPAVRIHLLISGTATVVAQDPDTGQVRTLSWYTIYSAYIAALCCFSLCRREVTVSSKLSLLVEAFNF
jgi:CRP-like cAMP-binding protein